MCVYVHTKLVSQKLAQVFLRPKFRIFNTHGTVPRNVFGPGATDQNLQLFSLELFFLCVVATTDDDDSYLICFEILMMLHVRG